MRLYHLQWLTKLFLLFSYLSHVEASQSMLVSPRASYSYMGLSNGYHYIAQKAHQAFQWIPKNKTKTCSILISALIVFSGLLAKPLDLFSYGHKEIPGKKTTFCFSKMSERFDDLSNLLLYPNIAEQKTWYSVSTYLFIFSLPSSIRNGALEKTELSLSERSYNAAMYAFIDAVLPVGLTAGTIEFIKLLAERPRPLTHCKTNLNDSITNYLLALTHGAPTNYTSTSALQQDLKTAWPSGRAYNNDKLLTFILNKMEDTWEKTRPYIVVSTSLCPNKTSELVHLLCLSPQKIYDNKFVPHLTEPNKSYVSGHTGVFTAIVFIFVFQMSDIFLLVTTRGGCIFLLVPNDSPLSPFSQSVQQQMEWLNTSMWCSTVLAMSSGCFMGIFRMMADKHYPTDIIAGGALGILLPAIIRHSRQKYLILQRFPAHEASIEQIKNTTKQIEIATIEKKEEDEEEESEPSLESITITYSSNHNQYDECSERRGYTQELRGDNIDDSW